MANFTVPTSPPGVWPVETATIDTVIYGQVEADVLRKRQGDLLVAVDQRDRLDNIEKSTHRRPKATVALANVSAYATNDGVTFTVEFSGDPVAEVNWYRTEVGGVRTLLADSDTDVGIVTDTDSSVLTLDNLVVGQNGTVIEVELRNYKGTAISSATLTVTTHAVPAITSLTPDTGAAAGGTVVVVAGTALDGATAVTFDGTPGTSFTVDSATQITVTSPAHAAGPVSVIVESPYGNSPADTYTYT